MKLNDFYYQLADFLYHKGYKNIELSLLKDVHESIRELEEEQYQKTISDISNETYFTPSGENSLYKMFKEYNQETSLAQICKDNSKEFNEDLFENQIYQIIDASKQGKYQTTVEFSGDCSDELINQFVIFITEQRLICDLNRNTKSVKVKWTSLSFASL